MSEPIKKISLSLLTAIFVAVVVFGSLSFVQPAKAQVPVPLPVADIHWPIQEVKLAFEELLKTAVLNASLQVEFKL